MSGLVIKLGVLGVFLVAIADSSFLTLPEGNDILIVLLSAGNSWQVMSIYVCATVAGSVLGCLALFQLGRRGGSAILQKRFSAERVRKMEGLFARYGGWAIFVPSILPPPCPFKIFVLSAGVCGMNSAVFFGSTIAGRTVRYATWGILAVIYGNPVRRFMQENLPAVGFFLMAIVGLTIAGLLIFAVLKRRGNRNPQDV